MFNIYLDSHQSSIFISFIISQFKSNYQNVISVQSSALRLTIYIVPPLKRHKGNWISD